MKKICFYIVSIVLVVIITLQITRNVDVKSVLNTFENIPSEEAAIQVVYEALLNGDTEATIQYSGNKEVLEQYTQSVVEAAFLIDNKDTSDDFDYMKNKYRGYTASIKGMGVYTIYYKFEYSETDVQTEWVNEKVASILKEFDFEEKTEYEKVKMIHDYIIDHVSYDITVENNSAYEGLKNQVTACQGYANLTYKLLTEAGIPARIITGVADGEAHAWNIVELDGKWYNLDCTWDDPIGGGNHNAQYDYFLKSESDFTDHIREEEYDTEEFHQTYQMSDENWKAN